MRAVSFRFILVLFVLAALVRTGRAQFASTPSGQPQGPVAEESKLIDVDSADDRPSFTLDGQTMFFGSRRFSKDPWRIPDANPQYKWDSDIWYRELHDTVWSAPINLGPPVNNSGGQINPTVHPRGDLVYYVSGEGGATLWQANLVKGKFQNPRPVGGELNRIYNAKSLAGSLFMDSVRRIVMKEMEPDSDLRRRLPEAYDLHFRERLVKHFKTQGAVNFALNLLRCESAITPDGRFGIFSENFGETGKYGFQGFGEEDLWVAQINEKGDWDSVKALNGNVSSPFADTYPFIAADGVTLYFTSNRPCGTCAAGTSGGNDIYVTRFDGNHWVDPVPLGPPFNSERDDYGFSIGPDGETAYFVSNRTGQSRLYQVKLHARDSAVAPKPVTIFQGRVTDAITGKPVKAEIFADDITESKAKFSVTSDSTTGNYVLALVRGHKFGLQAIASGYLPHSERFAVPAHGAFDRNKLDIALAPVAVGSKVEFKNVYFDFSKSDLLSESKLELDRVAIFLALEKSTIIEIQGHTDDVGSEDANQKLSVARARSVMSYLVSKGIAPNRLKAVGYGKTRPIEKGTDEAARAKNRRVEMLITSNTK
jgi:outer membrane protein OmpA-like peptidoglycan-associated protein